MSNWKSISKGSYDFGSFTKMTPIPSSDPTYGIKHEGNKVRYSEGDEITTASNHVFNVDFTGVPHGPDHNPCGYWHRNYVPPYWYVYTSRAYPIEAVDSLTAISIEIISGEFISYAPKLIDFSDELITSSIDLTSGVFKSIVNNYSLIESLNTSSIILSSGVFKDIVHNIGLIESIETSTINLTSGVFKDVVINYTYGLPESLKTSTIELSGGSHGS